MEQVLPGARLEYRRLHMSGRLGYLFPYLRISRLPQACQEAAPLLAAENDHLARRCTSWHDRVRLADLRPVPCGTSRETVKRSELAGRANNGSCAAAVRPGLQLIRLHRRCKAPRHGSIGAIRQWIEPINDAPKAKLNKEPRDGHTTEGGHARMAQRLSGMAVI